MGRCFCRHFLIAWRLLSALSAVLTMACFGVFALAIQPSGIKLI
jgi:hypothetical protein